MINVTAKFDVIGKPEPRPWKDDTGKERLSYKLNISQNDGSNIGTLSVPEEVYVQVRRGDFVTCECAFVEYGDKGTLRILGISKLDMPNGAPASVKPAPAPAK